MLIGLELLAIGTCVCMKAALGCGTRDALMVAISRRTKVPAGICRIVLEFTAGLLGYLMGGQLGIGTIRHVVHGAFIRQPLYFKIESIQNTFEKSVIRSKTGAS